MRKFRVTAVFHSEHERIIEGETLEAVLEEAEDGDIFDCTRDVETSYKIKEIYPCYLCGEDAKTTLWDDFDESGERTFVWWCGCGVEA